jgi:hypothetical protein
MTNRHHVRHPQSSDEVARSPFSAKTIFDKTKLSVVAAAPKTTTYGINRPFRLNSTRQNCAIRSLFLDREPPFRSSAPIGPRPPQIDATEVTLCENVSNIRAAMGHVVWRKVLLRQVS